MDQQETTLIPAAHLEPGTNSTEAGPAVTGHRPPKRQGSSFRENSKLILLATLFAPLLSVIDVVIVNISLPFIRDQYKASESAVEIVVAVYLIGYAVFLVTGSRAGDYFGRKKIYIAAMVGFTISSVLCGLAGSIGWLIFFRFVQGISAAFMVPQAITIIQLTFPEPHERDRAFGYYGIALGLAGIIGQYLGGYFVSSTFIKEGWRLIFLVNLPVGVIATLLAFLFLKETKQNRDQRFDLGGVALLTPALVFLLYPLIQGRELGWPPWCVLMLPLAGILLALFFYSQRKKSLNNGNPLVNTALFRFRSFNLGMLAVLFFFGVHNSFLLISAFYLQRSLHLAPYSVGLYFTLYGTGFLLASYISIRNIARFGIRMLQFGSVLMILSLLLQIFLFPRYAGAGPICGLLFLYGIGQGLILPSILNVTLRSIPLEYAGLAGGVYSTIQQFSSALGISFIGGIFFYFLDKGGHAYSAGIGVMIAYLVIALFLLEGIKRMGIKRRV